MKMPVARAQENLYEYGTKRNDTANLEEFRPRNFYRSLCRNRRRDNQRGNGRNTKRKLAPDAVEHCECSRDFGDAESAQDALNDNHAKRHERQRSCSSPPPP